MIDIKKLRASPDAFKESLKGKRYSPETLDRILEMDEKWREMRSEVDELRALKNRVSSEIPKAADAERDKLIKDMKEVSADLKEKEPELKELNQEIQSLLIHIPNPPHESVPEGKVEEENKEIKASGEKPEFNFEPKDHLELGEKLGLIDVTRAAKVSGTRFGYLMREAALMEFALIRYSLKVLLEAGFIPVIPPAMVREQAMFGTGFFPADEFEIYKIEGEDHYLVGTSEVSLAAYHADEILDFDQLPVRMTGFSTCYRKEAGSYGKDTRGIFRVHQFDKVEMFSFTDPEKSWEEHELLLSLEEKIIKGLGLPYRVVNVCTGELGAPAAKKYDIEAWFPGQNRYRELTSCSNCTDFQARRLNIRTRTAGKNVMVHTLNGTAVAIGRTLIALIENGQQEDGSVQWPDVLKKYSIIAD